MNRMNTINQNLPLFKNMQQAIVEDTSNYENIKPKQKMPLSRIDFQSSKFFKIILIIFWFIELCKSSSKNDVSPKPKKYSKQKLKENNNNNTKFNSALGVNNMKCINANIIESEDHEKKISVESLGNREYELCLKNALKEALDENEKVRDFLIFLFI